jgi:hypothetical protein
VTAVRFRFSLSTLLLAATWTAVVVWMNATPRRLTFEDYVDPEGYPRVHHYYNRYGFPWIYASEFFLGRRSRPIMQHGSRTSDYSALAGDIALGLLLVVVLTAGSNRVLRRVEARTRHRPALLLREGQSQDSHANKSTPPPSATAG